MTKYSTILLSLMTLSHSRAITTRTISTATDIVDGVCKPITLLFARGTTEPGNLGLTVGPPLAAAMMAAFGNGQVAIQGVDYPADIPGAATGAFAPQEAVGAKNMVALVEKVGGACPESKVVLSGYSQGAEQVRGALMNMPVNSASMKMIAAAVTFGDPLEKDQFANIDQAKTKVNCAVGDQVCNMLFLISAAHLSYGVNGDVGTSVQFVKSALGM